MSKQTKILSFDEARAHSARRNSTNSSNNGRTGADYQRSSRDASSYSRYNSQAASEYSSRRNNAGYRQQGFNSGADIRARVAQNARSSSYSSMSRFEQESLNYTTRSASSRSGRQQANYYQRSDAEFRDLRNPRSVRGANTRGNSYTGRSSGRSFAEDKYAVRNSWDRQEEEQDFEENARYNRDQELTTKEKLIKKFRSSKAEKQFNRTVGQDDMPQESGSRAALYEMRMGKTHRRSADMQSEGKGGRSGKKSSFSFAMPLHFLTTKVGVFLIGLLICGGLLYQPAADYYNETRKVQQLEAEYQALQEHNSNLKSEVDFLQTDEGMINYGRDQYGLIVAGEHQVNVEGVTSSVNHTTAKDTNHSVLTSGVKTPSTWYSGVLDVVFGYKG